MGFPADLLGLLLAAFLITQPLVLGPASVPLISDVGEAGGDIALWVLSCLVHGRDPAHADILVTLARALNDMDPDDAVVYARVCRGRSHGLRGGRDLEATDEQDGHLLPLRGGPEGPEEVEARRDRAHDP
ncbi:hypothetical protein ACRAWF_30690 [Streptomyces sp. L7]